MPVLSFLKSKSIKPGYITVVSGLPRSGTSMMMQILEAGGIPPITDNVRQADTDNSRGYYEHELVKALVRGNQGSLKDAQGKVIKVVSTLLRYLSQKHQYKVIFMHRELQHVLASQKRMLNNLGSNADQENDSQLTQFYTEHLSKINSWLNQRDNIQVLHLNYADLLADPKKNIKQLLNFLELDLNSRKMLTVIDASMRHH